MKKLTTSEVVDAVFDKTSPHAVVDNYSPHTAALLELALHAGWTESEFRARIKARMGA